MQPEPFRSFDPGWVIAGFVLFLGLLWLWIEIIARKPLQDDDDAEDWDVEPMRSDPESDARHRPF